LDGYRKLLGSKIHRATVTHADLEYEGSITVPPDLLKAANILPYEAVQIWNVTSGTRLETYAVEGTSDSRDICINGAAAHLIKPKEVVIIARFVYLSEADCKNHEPIVVLVDKDNRIKEIRKEIPGPRQSFATSPKARV
jgi:aspartate 1-decarboxylase